MQKRLSTGISCALAVLCLAGCASSTTPQRGAYAPGTSSGGDLCYAPSSVNADASRRLNGPVAFGGGAYTLVGVARIIHTQTGVPVRFDWDGLAEAEITRETTVELAAGQAPARKLLSMSLFEADQCTPAYSWRVHPTYLLIDGAAVVGTNRSLRRIAPQVDWPEGGPRIIDADAHTRRTLDEQIIACDFDTIPLHDLITYIGDSAGLNIAVNWRALEIVEIERDTPITMSASHLTAGLLLELALEQAGAENFDDDKAGYALIDGVVKVTTLSDLKTLTDVRIYDIRDLVGRPYGPMLEAAYADDAFAIALLRKHRLAWALEVEQRRRRPVFDLNDALSGTNSGGAPIQEDSFDGPANPLSEREMMLDDLTMFIQDTVGDPDEWLDEESTIRELNGNFIIKTTPDNHRDIEGLLSRLREARGYDRFFREVEVARLLREAEALRADDQHAQALGVVERALDVDPNSEVARALRRVIADTIARQDARGASGR